MSKSLYITTTEARSGKSAISMGIMELLLRNVSKVGFFRPIINMDHNGNKRDKDLHLFISHYKLDMAYEDMYAYTFDEANKLITSGRHDELFEGVLGKFNQLKNHYDFVLCEGTDFEGLTSAFEFDINADLANNLNSPVIIVTKGRDKNIEQIVSSTRIAIESFEEKGCAILATIVNRVENTDVRTLTTKLRQELGKNQGLIYAIPENKELGAPTVGEIAQYLHAKVLHGENQLHRRVNQSIMGAMQVSNFLQHIEEGSLVITPGDRVDIVLASALAMLSLSTPHIAGILLTRNLPPDENVWKLIQGMPNLTMPILMVESGTFSTATKVNSIHAGISPHNHQKIATVLNTFESYVNIPELRERIVVTQARRVTPKMFEFGLIQRAKSKRQHIVLPEGEEERILKATEILQRREVVEITLLGEEEEIDKKVKRLGLQLNGVNIVNPRESSLRDEYAQKYFELRKHKKITENMARDTMSDVCYFGTMMVHNGHADGMVSGSIHTTQHTIRPAFEFVRTKSGCSLVSSVFFMCLEDRVLVYGDCAVNPNPTADQLAEIAVTSADTAFMFGIEPRVAMLSYSTGSSGKGQDVEKVATAAKKAKEWRPDLKIEGPLQYDAAVDPEVARTKMPDSQVAGKATVFIFPDLNTGNNTYKAVQRSAKAVAIGPVLQGLNKPVNDLSRGCTVPDIVNTVAITAIQAQQTQKG